MAVFDPATLVYNTELRQETNLWGTPYSEFTSGNYDFTSSLTYYDSGGWIEFEGWEFYMHSLDVTSGTGTFGNNPCQFYPDLSNGHWDGTQAGAGFNGNKSSFEA